VFRTAFPGELADQVASRDLALPSTGHVPFLLVYIAVAIMALMVAGTIWL